MSPRAPKTQPRSSTEEKKKKKKKEQKKPKAAPRAAALIAHDPRFVALVRAFRRDPALRAIVDAFEKSLEQESARKFGSNALKVGGKLFALLTQGTLVVKLPKARVGALVTAGVGVPFDPGHGRAMKEWLTITDDGASWSELAQEAHRFVAGGA